METTYALGLHIFTNCTFLYTLSVYFATSTLLLLVSPWLADGSQCCILLFIRFASRHDFQV